MVLTPPPKKKSFISSQFSQAEGWGCWVVNLLFSIVLLIFAQYSLYFLPKARSNLLFACVL